ncbi:MAG: hypothetical protein ACK5KO_02140, partial [Arachnia sp.]
MPMLHDRRLSYELASLGDDAPAHPLELFDAWLSEALSMQDHGAPFEASAMTLATVRVGADGTLYPEAR